MTKSTILVLLMVLVLGRAARAEPICFSTLEEIEEKKDTLPSILHKYPILMSVDNFLVTAAIKIRIVDGKEMKMEGHIWTPGEIYSDEGYLKKACLDGKKLSIYLTNGKTYTTKIKNDKTMEIEGVDFTQSTDAQFAAVIEKVKKEEAKRSDGKANGGGASGGTY